MQVVKIDFDFAPKGVVRFSPFGFLCVERVRMQQHIKVDFAVQTDGKDFFIGRERAEPFFRLAGCSVSQKICTNSAAKALAVTTATPIDSAFLFLRIMLFL